MGPAEVEAAQSQPWSCPDCEARGAVPAPDPEVPTSSTAPAPKPKSVKSKSKPPAKGRRWGRRDHACSLMRTQSAERSGSLGQVGHERLVYMDGMQRAGLCCMKAQVVGGRGSFARGAGP